MFFEETHKRKREEDESDEGSSTEILSSQDEENEDTALVSTATDELFFKSIELVYDGIIKKDDKTQTTFIGKLYYSIAKSHKTINQDPKCKSSLHILTQITFLKYAIAEGYYLAISGLKRIYLGYNKNPKLIKQFKKEFLPEEYKLLSPLFSRTISKEDKKKLISSFAPNKNFLDVISDYIAYITSLFSKPQVTPKLFANILRSIVFYDDDKTATHLLDNAKIMDKQYSKFIEEEHIRMNKDPSLSSGTLENLCNDELEKKSDNDRHVGFKLTSSQT